MREKYITLKNSSIDVRINEFKFLNIPEDSILWVERAIERYKCTKRVFKNLAKQLKI